ncbi:MULTISPECIES: DoxX-like family protein [Pseudomonadaceae]|uniref:DoxX-like family protein n=1 Tax=Ectopseudomonas toyotomiensis TaxID=554344 RepID=A0A1I5SRM5_9GAMM|nr:MULTISPECIES: DoxX-like family protein [Pseudomonas]MBG0840600.1 DoxX-like family protein [Pseudomonas toyotomiensis]MDH0702277.1 DoxX-like family protein [Pseudomonas toyotomiensis]PIA69554.1 DoxX family protein [Pseudomonas toyotomiensis]SDA75928.1 DoxX-like family protein [Pseudomonas sp. NFPP33]SFP73444.1 DoxX-like family protein [Pseudomonas toyotomiensis]
MTERRLAQIAWLARLALALVFIWHGLAPKILWLSPDEVAMIAAHGLPDHPLFAPQLIAAVGGIVEILLGVLLLTARRQRWPLLVAGGVLLVLLLDVVLLSPHLLIQAFNPLSTNLAALALCAVAWLAEAPSAADS